MRVARRSRAYTHTRACVACTCVYTRERRPKAVSRACLGAEGTGRRPVPSAPHRCHHRSQTKNIARYARVRTPFGRTYARSARSYDPIPRRGMGSFQSTAARVASGAFGPARYARVAARKSLSPPERERFARNYRSS